MLKSVIDFFIQWWDVLAFLLLSIILIYVNIRLWQVRKSGLSLQELAQKQLGATILTGASSAAISVTSILISAILVYIQLAAKSPTNPHHEALDHAFRVIIWLLASLFMGLFLIWIHGMHGQFKNAATNLYITIPLGLQFLTLAIGAGHILISIYHALYK